MRCWHPSSEVKARKDRFVIECETRQGRFRLHDRDIHCTIGVSFNEGKILLSILEIMGSIHRG